MENSDISDISPVKGMGLLRAINASNTIIVTPSDEAGLNIYEINDASDYDPDKYKYRLAEYIGEEDRNEVDEENDELILTLIAHENLHFEYDSNEPKTGRTQVSVIEYYV